MTYTQEMGRRFWFEFDKSTKYTPSFMQIVGRAGAGGIQTAFAETRVDETYPEQFLALVEPRRADWQVLADVQTDAVQRWLDGDWANVQAAFEDFGQGTLLDTDPQRAANNDSIHTMDIQGAAPPVGYHRWHASIRAIQLLQIGEAGWWEKLDELLGLAWGIQSFARPRQTNVANPPIPAADLDDLRASWLAMDPERRDRQYDLTGDVGYHPSPKKPAA
ncbi:hypothetical protein [Enterovirga sp.]|uniref:hypothetical protein n=1 Tax=Enterovirga sp. TaxID=2026350 RepID=UPI002CA9861B|nr:hypothetical protein [Enterovirga sp.]HMO29484.1 hypothetical protein [Enterovirga sp.]